MPSRPLSSCPSEYQSSEVSDPNQRYSQNDKATYRSRLDSEAETVHEDFNLQPIAMSAFPSSSTLATTTPLRKFSDSIILDMEKDQSKADTSQRTSNAEDSDSMHSIPFPQNNGPLAPAEPLLSLPHKIAFVVIACLAQFLNLGGMYQTVASLMVLSDYFNIHDYGTLSWFSAAYSLTVGTFILPAGKKLKLPISSFTSLLTF
jgi:hypothetical protein